MTIGKSEVHDVGAEPSDSESAPLIAIPGREPVLTDLATFARNDTDDWDRRSRNCDGSSIGTPPGTLSGTGSIVLDGRKDKDQR